MATTPDSRVEEPLAYPFGTGGLDLDPILGTLRRTRPVVPVRLPFGEDAWLATRHADVRAVLSDPRFSRGAGERHDQPRTMKDLQAVGLVAMDPPEHTRLRALVTGAFTHRRAEQQRPAATAVATGLVQRMRADGPPGDLTEQFARPLTHTVIADLLGVPRSDQDRFRLWSDVGLSTTAHSEEYKLHLLGEMWEYLEGTLQRRRSEPGDDLLSAMVQAQGAEHSDADLVILAMTVLVAGYETTASQLPNFVLAVLSRPELADRLRAHPEMIGTAVEELLRWVPIEAGPGPARYTVDETDLGGTTLPGGCPVLVDTASANHDPDVFADPDRIDPERSPNPHVAFGYGPHRCLGAQLARMLLQVGLATLLSELPGLRLADVPEALAWKPGMLVRALETLPVTW